MEQGQNKHALVSEVGGGVGWGVGGWGVGWGAEGLGWGVGGAVCPVIAVPGTCTQPRAPRTAPHWLVTGRPRTPVWQPVW